VSLSRQWSWIGPLHCAALIVLGLGAAWQARALGVLVPAYFDPTAGSAWGSLNLAAQRVPLIAIMNPNNGPSTAPNAAYRQAITALRNAGGLVIGYVYSSYTTRAIAEVKADIDRYDSFYTIDGIFVDEMTNDSDATHLAYYEELYRYIKSKRLSYLVVGNPGINTLESYLVKPATDALVTFESNLGYAQYVPDSWTQAQPATAFSHLCYAVGSPATMTNYVLLAVARASRLKVWKTKPISSLRMRASSLSFIWLTCFSLSRYDPLLGVSRQPMRFISVDLPEPEGPMIATYSPRSIWIETPRSA
jgi:hypothetical protein